MSKRPNGIEVYNKEELKRSKEHIKVVNELSENNIVYLKKVITTFKFGSLVVMVKFSRIIGQLLAEQILISATILLIVLTLVVLGDCLLEHLGWMFIAD